MGAPYDTVLSDVFAVQASIAAKVAEALNVALAAAGRRQRIARRPTVEPRRVRRVPEGRADHESLGNVERRDAAARGWSITRRAVALDSTFARAWSAIARAHSISRRHVSDQGVGRARARGGGASAAAGARPPRRAVGDGLLSSSTSSWITRGAPAVPRGTQARPEQRGSLLGLATVERTSASSTMRSTHLKQAALLDPRSVVRRDDWPRRTTTCDVSRRSCRRGIARSHWRRTTLGSFRGRRSDFCRSASSTASTRSSSEARDRRYDGAARPFLDVSRR